MGKSTEMFRIWAILDPQTGEYLGEECRHYGTPNQESHWNLTNCTDLGGTIDFDRIDNYEWNSSDNNGTENNAYMYAPDCINIPELTIHTSSDEALLIYHFYESMTDGNSLGWYSYNQFSLVTTCDGVSVSYNLNNAKESNRVNEYGIAAGSGLDCVHELTRTMEYLNEPNGVGMYSLVYSIQGVTVV